MDRYSETVVEFYDENNHLTVSTGKRKYINKIKQYAEKYSELVSFVENQDGSICATMPIDWFKFPSPKKTKELTDEQRAELVERVKKAREMAHGA